MRRQPLGGVGPTETIELEAKGGVKDRRGHAVPVVQGVLGPPDRRLRHARELYGDLERPGLDG